MKSKILLFLLMFLFIPLVLGSVNYTLNAPAAFFETTATSVTFNWTAQSGLNTSINSTLYINNTLNKSILCTNATACNVTVTSIGEGFYKWFVSSIDVGSTTYNSSSRWYEVRNLFNLTNFIWANDTTNVMWLNRNTGDLNISGDFYAGGGISYGGNLTIGLVDSNIIPSLNATYDLGNQTRLWNLTFTNELIIFSPPAACPANNAMTQFFGNKSTCADNWVNIGGDTMTGSLSIRYGSPIFNISSSSSNQNVTIRLVENTGVGADAQIAIRAVYDNGVNAFHITRGSGFSPDFIISSRGNVNVTVGNLSIDGVENGIILPLNNDATTPTISFGDGDTGLYQDEDGRISVSITGSKIGHFTSTGYGGTGTNDAILLTAGSSSTAPGFAFTGDSDTGIGRHSADNLSLIAGGVEMIRISNGSDSILFRQTNDAVSPTIAFGDGDSGIYEISDDVISFTTGGISRFRIDGSEVWAGTGNRYALRNSDASSTNPNIIPSRDDSNTGIGQHADDNLSLIAGGVEMVRIVESVLDQVIIAPTLQDDSAAPSLAFGDGNTGFYESSDNNFRLSIAGSSTFVWSATSFGFVSGSTPRIDTTGNSKTDPNIMPSANDADTGMNTPGTNQLNLIAGAKEIIRVSSFGLNVTTGNLTIGTNVQSGITLINQSGNYNCLVITGMSVNVTSGAC